MTEISVDYAEVIEEHAEDIVEDYGKDYDNFHNECAGENPLDKDSFVKWGENLSIESIPEEFSKKWVVDYLDGFKPMKTYLKNSKTKEEEMFWRTTDNEAIKSILRDMKNLEGKLLKKATEKVELEHHSTMAIARKYHRQEEKGIVSFLKHKIEMVETLQKSKELRRKYV